MTTTPGIETLIATIDGRIGRLTLNQPEALNPIGTLALQEIAAAANWFNTTEASIVIVTGVGRAFSSGFDLREFGAKGGASADVGRQMADAMEAMSALTIAAIKGPCIGGGIVLASTCDLRIAADDTTFMIPEVDLGIPLAWGGIPRLVREIGRPLTVELVLTCRPFDAHEAKAAGFLNRVVARDQLESTVDELAELLARKAPMVVKATKRQVIEATENLVSTDGSWADAALMETARRDPEARAAGAAYLERRG